MSLNFRGLTLYALCTKTVVYYKKNPLYTFAALDFQIVHLLVIRSSAMSCSCTIIKKLSLLSGRGSDLNLSATDSSRDDVFRSGPFSSRLDDFMDSAGGGDIFPPPMATSKSGTILSTRETSLHRFPAESFGDDDDDDDEDGDGDDDGDCDGDNDDNDVCRCPP